MKTPPVIPSLHFRARLRLLVHAIVQIKRTKEKSERNSMKENIAMLSVFRKRYPDAGVTVTETDEYRVVMDFYEHAQPQHTLDKEIRRKMTDDLKEQLKTEIARTFLNDFEKVEAFERLVENVFEEKIDPQKAITEMVEKWLKEKST